MPEELDVDFDTQLQTVFARPGTTGKTHIEKHLAACNEEVDPSHGQLWRRLFAFLASLTPLPIQAMVDGVMFFAPDGKYRMQVFALEDHQDGVIHIYLQDLLEAALSAGILQKANEAGEYGISNQAGPTLRVDQLDANNTRLPSPYVKNMLGWNRKALRVTLVASQPSGPRVDAAEALCKLAARKWSGTTKN